MGSPWESVVSMKSYNRFPFCRAYVPTYVRECIRYMDQRFVLIHIHVCVRLFVCECMCKTHANSNMRVSDMAFVRSFVRSLVLSLAHLFAWLDDR